MKQIFIANHGGHGEHGEHGFTLLEIVVAIAIFAVIISLLYPAYTGTYRNIEAAETQAEIYEMARTAMIRIVEMMKRLSARMILLMAGKPIRSGFFPGHT
jgi:prepilin-type N-terminal cleavage/methylation domain-containing protein